MLFFVSPQTAAFSSWTANSYCYTDKLTSNLTISTAVPFIYQSILINNISLVSYYRIRKILLVFYPFWRWSDSGRDKITRSGTILL